MFVFVATGENYPHVVYHHVEHNTSLIVYFVFFSIAGTFFLIALLVANFQVRDPMACVR